MERILGGVSAMAFVTIDTSNEQRPACPWCGGPVERRQGEAPTKWRTRVTCSWECRGKHMQSALTDQPRRRKPHDPCVNCGCEIVQRENETRRKYLERKTCSRECTK